MKGKPVIVGGSTKDRGVVSTVSYEARAYGIHSAMPMITAKKLCPKGYFVPVNMKKYKEASKGIHDIFRRYSSLIEPISIDEAFLDITGKDSIKTSKAIKRDIFKGQNLTSSIGISVNKFLVKLASDMEKPDGLTIIRQKDAIEFLKPLQVRKLWGVGSKTERELNILGIYTIGDLQCYDVDVLIDKFGKRGEELLQFSLGLDNRPVERNITSQSIGEEETFLEDISNVDFLKNKIREYSIGLSFQLEYKNYLVRTITIKVKYEDLYKYKYKQTYKRRVESIYVTFLTVYTRL